MVWVCGGGELGGGELDGGGELEGGGELDGVVVGAGAAGAAVVVGAGALCVVTAAVFGADLCVAFLCVVFFLCVVVCFWVVVAGVVCAALVECVFVLDDPPQAASATAATIVVASVRFIRAPLGSSRTFAPQAMLAEIRRPTLTGAIYCLCHRSLLSVGPPGAGERTAEAAVKMHAILQRERSVGAQGVLPKSKP